MPGAALRRNQTSTWVPPPATEHLVAHKGCRPQHRWRWAPRGLGRRARPVPNAHAPQRALRPRAPQ
eukprot:11194849-Lingulodinium_polyedra.AAC.1